MKIPKEQIRDYIPQTDPFVMIDNLVEADGMHILTNFEIRADNIFIENGRLNELALIENIAQSGAAGLSILRGDQSSGKIEGFLGGIAKLNVYGQPRINETINTHLHLLAELGNMFRLRGESYSDQRLLLECEVTLVRVQKRP